MMTGMNLIIPEWPAPARVRAFSTLRNGGVSLPPYGGSKGAAGLNLGTYVGDDIEAVKKNRALLREQLPTEPAWLNQVHGSDVVNASAVKGVPDADASYTTDADTVCIIMTADCLPVLFCSADGRVVGAAHGGWRGLASGVLQNTLRQMRAQSDADVMAWFGPAIGPRVFQVGQDVLDVFVRQYPALAMEQAFVPEAGNPGKYLADIYLIARKILNGFGVSAVYGGDCCTVTDSDRFYSFRRDNGKTGRMATGIWLMPA